MFSPLLISLFFTQLTTLSDCPKNRGHYTHETAEFAVAAIRCWWLEVGRIHYADHTRLLIEADGGGANSCHCWLWKAGLQALADEFNLTITVTHFPTGASKWNPVEHRMFSPISANWAGQPLAGPDRTSFLRAGARGYGIAVVRSSLDYHTLVETGISNDSLLAP